MPTKKNAVKPPTATAMMRRIVSLEVALSTLGVVTRNQIQQLSADLHAEVGPLKHERLKVDRLLVKNADEFQRLALRVGDGERALGEVQASHITSLKRIEVLEKATMRPGTIPPTRAEVAEDPDIDVIRRAYVLAGLLHPLGCLSPSSLELGRTLLASVDIPSLLAVELLRVEGKR